MKFSGKKIVALIIALMMCSVMVTGFAAEPAITITNVKILDSASHSGIECPNFKDGISLSAAQMLQITARVTNVEDAQISFISYTDPDGGAAEYTDSTIQYLDQKTAVGNEATFIFRPRIDEGTFVAMTGATDVTLVDSFNYTVVPTDKDMVVTGSVSYPANEIENAVLTIEGVIDEISSVRIDDTELIAETQYTVATDEDSNTTTITILASAIPETIGTYKVMISAEGYNDGTATIRITAANIPIPDEDVADAQEKLDSAVDVLDTVTPESDGSYTIDISDKNVTVGETEKTITFAATNKSAGVTEEDGKLVFKPTADTPFVGKATVTATLASNVTVIKDVYFIPEDTTISYGNVTALTSNGKDDAFAITGVQETDDANFEAWVKDSENTADIAYAKMKALAIGAGRTDESEIAAATDTLDFNRQDGISLNEYNIYRKMIGCFEGFGITAVNNARAQYNN